MYDITGKRKSELKFEGDMYRFPFEKLKSEFFNQDVVANLRPTSKYAGDNDRVERISRGSDVDEDELEPMIDLADIWIPGNRETRTYAVSNRQFMQLQGGPLAIIPWTGSEHGPYVTLGLATSLKT